MFIFACSTFLHKHSYSNKKKHIDLKELPSEISIFIYESNFFYTVRDKICNINKLKQIF